MANNIFLTRDGKLDAVDLPAFTSLVQRLTNKQSKVLLHIHGGLVNQAAGQAAAQRERTEIFPECGCLLFRGG